MDVDAVILIAEAKEEYVKKFVQGTLGHITWNNVQEKVQCPQDHTSVDEGPLSPSLTQKLAPLDIQPDEMGQLGYMPNRDDYEKVIHFVTLRLCSSVIFGALCNCILLRRNLTTMLKNWSHN